MDLNNSILLKAVVLFLAFIAVYLVVLSFYCRKSKYLSKREKAIIKISSYTAQGNMKKLKKSLNCALNNKSLTVNEIKEILVQLYAYTGFPRSLNAINTFMSIMDERKSKGINDTIGEEAKDLSSREDKNKYGENVRTELTGVSLKAGFQEFTPAIDNFLKEHLFADIFARGVLSYQDREMATISALSSLKGVESQLKSHIMIGINTGISYKKLKDLMFLNCSGWGYRSLKEVMKGKRVDGGNFAPIDTVMGQGEINPYSKFFTGRTYLKNLVGGDNIYDDISIGNVVFEPSARTNWHKHTKGQILLVLSGEGRYQERGKEIRKLTKGDVVEIPANVEHWHGASPNSWFTHISIMVDTKNNGSTWLEAVGDGEYK